MGTAAAVASVYNIVNRLLTSWPRGMLGIRLLLLLLLFLLSPLLLSRLYLSLFPALSLYEPVDAGSFYDSARAYVRVIE